MNVLLKISVNLFRKLRRSIHLNRYNDFTIAEYFRKQGALIGENNRIEVRDLGAEPYLVKIGNHCTIGPNVAFLCHDGATWLFTEEHPSLQKFGSIEIMDNCFIGISATILGNVRIGPNAIVGACSVITRDVPPNTIVAGNPARVVSTIEQYKEKALRIWAQQKPPGYFEGLKESIKYQPAYIQKIKSRELQKLKKHLIKLFRNELQETEPALNYRRRNDR